MIKNEAIEKKKLEKPSIGLVEQPPTDGEIIKKESKSISNDDAAKALIKEYQGKIEKDKQLLAKKNKAVNDFVAQHNQAASDINISLLHYAGAIKGLEKLLEGKK